ncbi:MAG: BrnA antitoxin family protein [Deltaproteobacteria bacterium]|nr:BrnA antitoxin family protein [Deltaproteobacteria bacterium]
MKRLHEDFELKEEYDFSKGIRGRFYQPKKVSTTLRLDDDILLYFKKLSTEKKIGYQTLMNSVLRDYVHEGHSHA